MPKKQKYKKKKKLINFIPDWAKDGDLQELIIPELKAKNRLREPLVEAAVTDVPVTWTPTMATLNRFQRVRR